MMPVITASSIFALTLLELETGRLDQLTRRTRLWLLEKSPGKVMD